MADVEHVISAYERVVNATDHEEQEAAAREALADDVEFVGPQFGHVSGHAGLLAALRDLRAQGPGDDIRIRRTTAIDEHHGWWRFGWEFVNGSGEVLAAGTDVGQLGEDGKIRRIVVFFGGLQPRA